MPQSLQLPIRVKLESPVAMLRTASARIDITGMLPKTVRGVVDEHSFTMVELTESGKIPVSVQFSSDPHPRLPQDTPAVRIPKTPPLGAIPRAFPTAFHYSCADQWELTSSSGEFIWLMQPSKSIERHFMLKFDVADEGEFIQYGYFPNNYIVFYGSRISRMRQFQKVEVGPHITPDKKLNITIDQEPFLTYNYGSERAKPYFYPVIGPSGVGITTDGKQHDPADSHVHHHSLWIAHQSVNGVNFWEEWPDNGRVTHTGFDRLECGSVCANIVERNVWERGGRAYAYETRVFRPYSANGDFRMMDVQINMSSETAGRFAGDLKIGKNIWGFLAARVKESMAPADSGGEITNSRGEVGEEEVIWETAEWMDISGAATAGEWNGIAIFDHPGNASYPNKWQCRNDGFICTAFSCDSDFHIKQGDTLTVNHRVFFHKGDSSQGGVARAFEDYAGHCSIDIGEIVREQ